MKAEIHQHSHACHHSQTDTSARPCVALVPIFNHLELEQMNEIMETAHSVSYKKGETVYHAGDQSNSLYIVNKGKIRIYRLAESGKEQLVRLVQAGDFTGEYALFTESVHESYAEAMEDTRVCMIKRTNLEGFLLKYPSIALKILAEFSSRLEKSEKQSTSFVTESVETRLALFLTDLNAKDPTVTTVKLPMSKKDLASYLGTTPETISRRLADLEEQGYIKQKPHKQIEILDRDGLLLV